MSGRMRIEFADDMPIASVEVLSPDLQTVDRVALAPGGAYEVEVSSEASFIRVHLPSGRAVTMRHPGDLRYTVTRSELQNERPSGISAPQAAEVHDMLDYHRERPMLKAFRRTHGAEQPLPDLPQDGAPPPPAALLPDGVTAVFDTVVDGTLSVDGRELEFTPSPRLQPYILTVNADGQTLTVRLPGALDAAYVRVDEIGEAESAHGGGTRPPTRMVSVRVSTTSDAADTLGAYLARGDYFSAETLSEWAAEAEHMLWAKMQNPWAATVGAYLLLRLERFERMHHWTRNLATWFDFLPDGCVIWAWQNILQDNGDPKQVGPWLLHAAERGLPVHTEGLRLLTDGLRLLGDDGAAALRRLSLDTGAIVWTSPFTATLTGTPGDTSVAWDVAYVPTL